MPTNYLRAGLAQGMDHEQKLGVNPFKFGIVGGTDVHNSLTAIEEDNFYGKHVNQEPSPNRWEHVSKQGFGKTRYTYHYMAAGYAAVWATDNTRDALWDAMKRKEVYATSGTRMTVRFFGGYGYTADDAKTRYLAERGYAKGVPMGGDLASAPAGKAPTFLVAALKDPIGGNLDRIQIVKSWVDSAGKTQERIYNVAWSGGRKPNKDGRLPPSVTRSTWRTRRGPTRSARPNSQPCGRIRTSIRASGRLLRACHRDSDAHLARLRPTALRREDVQGRSDEAPGAGLDLADLVLAEELIDYCA